MSQSNETDTYARHQFITFRSADQEFGADIMTIREIRGWTQTTPLPHAPDYVRGVINLRGVVLPVIDLKARLGRGATEVTGKHVIIVVKCGERTMGLMVDAVSDILIASDKDIQAAPELARDQGCEFVSGICVLDERMVTLLDMELLTASLTADKAMSRAA